MSRDIEDMEQEARQIAWGLANQLGDIYQLHGKKDGKLVSDGILEYLKDKKKYWEEEV